VDVTGEATGRSSGGRKMRRRTRQAGHADRQLCTERACQRVGALCVVVGLWLGVGGRGVQNLAIIATSLFFRFLFDLLTPLTSSLKQRRKKKESNNALF